MDGEPHNAHSDAPQAVELHACAPSADAQIPQQAPLGPALPWPPDSQGGGGGEAAAEEAAVNQRELYEAAYERVRGSKIFSRAPFSVNFADGEDVPVLECLYCKHTKKRRLAEALALGDSRPWHARVTSSEHRSAKNHVRGMKAVAEKAVARGMEVEQVLGLVVPDEAVAREKERSYERVMGVVGDADVYFHWSENSVVSVACRACGCVVKTVGEERRGRSFADAWARHLKRREHRRGGKRRAKNTTLDAMLSSMKPRKASRTDSIEYCVGWRGEFIKVHKKAGSTIVLDARWLTASDVKERDQFLGKSWAHRVGGGKETIEFKMEPDCIRASTCERSRKSPVDGTFTCSQCKIVERCTAVQDLVARHNGSARLPMYPPGTSHSNMPRAVLIQEIDKRNDANYTLKLEIARLRRHILRVLTASQEQWLREAGANQDVIHLVKALLQCTAEGKMGKVKHIVELFRDGLARALGQKSRRYSTALRNMLEAFADTFGTKAAMLLAATLAPNLSRSTIFKWHSKHVMFELGVSAVNVMTVLRVANKIVGDVKRAGKSHAPVGFVLAVDETFIQRRGFYDPTSDTVSGFCNFCSVDEHDRYVHRVGHDDTGDAFDALVSMYKDPTRLAKFVSVVMLVDSTGTVPPLPVAVIPTCGKFSSVHATQMIVDLVKLLLEHGAEEVVGKFMGIASDGDSRRRKSLSRDSDSFVSFFVMDRDPYQRCFFDCYHVLKRLINHLLHKRELRWGADMTSMACQHAIGMSALRELRMNDEVKQRLQLTEEMTERTDRQDVKTAMHVAKLAVMEELQQHTNFTVQATFIPEAAALYYYLSVVHSYVNVFYGSAGDRGWEEHVSDAAFVMRILTNWRCTVSSDRRLSIEDNFLTSETFADAVLSCQAFIEAVAVSLRCASESGTTVALYPHRLGSECCELYFSRMGGFTDFHRTYDAHEMTRKTARLLRLHILDDPQGTRAFPRSTRPSDSTWSSMNAFPGRNPHGPELALQPIVDMSDDDVNEQVRSRVASAVQRGKERADLMSRHIKFKVEDAEVAMCETSGECDPADDAVGEPEEQGIPHTVLGELEGEASALSDLLHRENVLERVVDALGGAGEGDEDEDMEIEEEDEEEEEEGAEQEQEVRDRSSSLVDRQGNKFKKQTLCAWLSREATSKTGSISADRLVRMQSADLEEQNREALSSDADLRHGTCVAVWFNINDKPQWFVMKVTRIYASKKGRGSKARMEMAGFNFATAQQKKRQIELRGCYFKHVGCDETYARFALGAADIQDFTRVKLESIITPVVLAYNSELDVYVLPRHMFDQVNAELAQLTRTVEANEHGRVGPAQQEDVEDDDDGDAEMQDAGVRRVSRVRAENRYYSLRRVVQTVVPT